MEILLLLLLLQIKHWYADFKIQTYIQTVKKGIWLDPIGVSHTVDHICCTLVVMLIFSIFYVTSPIVLLVIAIIEGIAHYIIDYVKVRYGIKDQTNPLFWTQFGLDQLAHQICYITMTAYIAVH
jgi:hypothetical protein